MTFRTASFAAGAALLATMPAAFAADIPAPQPPAQAFVQEQVSFDWSGFYVGVYGGYGFGESSAAGVDEDADGGLAGGTIGFNMQNGSFVYGIEADGGWSGIEDDIDDLSVTWTSTVRGRIGYAFDSVLLYATGGGAIGGVESDITGGDDTRLGFAVGGGVEAALTDNISAKVEYLYVDLGEDDLGGIDYDFDAHTVKAGLNFHF